MAEKFISFHYILTDCDGEELESSRKAQPEPIAFVTGFGMIVPGLEKEIVSVNAGESRRIEVSADNAYGLIDFNKYVQVPIEALQKPDLKVGDVFRSNASPLPFTVKKIESNHVVLDANHPLAGEDLIFDVEVSENRDATEEEIKEIHEARAQMEAEMAAAQAQAEAAAQAEGGNEPPAAGNPPAQA